MNNFLHCVLEVHVEPILEDEFDFSALDEEVSAGLVANLLHFARELAILVTVGACDGREA